MSIVVAACLKLVDLRPEVDPLTGAVHHDGRLTGASEADRAALEWALRLAEAWRGSVVAVAAGPASAEPMLREAVAAGASRAIRVDLAAGAPSEMVASAISDVIADAMVVVCGDHSLDRGSGSVPAFLAQARAATQALGLIELTPAEAGVVRAVRRLDGGRREHLRTTGSAVLSVEGASAKLRRAALSATLTARSAVIDVRPGPAAAVGHAGSSRVRPYRPRAKALAGPPGATALDRVRSLTAADAAHSPAQVLELEPAAAAAAIVEQLRRWGYLS